MSHHPHHSLPEPNPGKLSACISTRKRPRHPCRGRSAHFSPFETDPLEGLCLGRHGIWMFRLKVQLSRSNWMHSRLCELS